jgi:ankyrin repeat protein
MSFRAFRAAAAAVLMLAAVPASAQHFSDGYKFLEGIRKGDGDQVIQVLNETNGSIINTKERGSGEGALHIVARRGDATYLRFLLQKGANPNIQDDKGNTPMLVAATAGYLEGVTILATYKANVNLGNASGETPLIRAVQLRNADMVRTLLNLGADPDRADLLAGMSARDYATSDARSPEIAKLLADAPKVKRAAVAGPRL